MRYKIGDFVELGPAVITRITTETGHGSVYLVIGEHVRVWLYAEDLDKLKVTKPEPKP